jgi:peptidoglycan/xylan/chitin deacetylase (PgdA/CDA1 family)
VSHSSRPQRASRRHRRLPALLGLVCIAGGAVAAALYLGGPAPRAHANRPVHRRPTFTVRKVRPPRARPHRRGTESVPILMYHVIASPPPGAPYPGLYVPPDEFAAQMRALAAAGFHGVTLDQVEANWRNGTPLPAGRPIVLTFDNGYRTHFTQALPVLRRLGWVADENLQLSGLPPSQGGLNAHEVRGLVAAGWELDTQGFTHADLPELGETQLDYEVAVARRTIQRLYHVRASWFCYPSGRYDPLVAEVVKEAGYEGSTTVVPGWASPTSDPYRLPRIRVLGGTTPQRLLELVAGNRADPPPPESY